MKTRLTGAFPATYELVFCIIPKPIYRKDEKGFFEVIGKDWGILIKRTQHQQIWYHYPHDYLEWKSFLKH